MTNTRTIADVGEIAGKGWPFMRGYLVAFVAWSLLGFLLGSFILGEVWNPFGTIPGRASIAWLSLMGLIAPVLAHLEQSSR